MKPVLVVLAFAALAVPAPAAEKKLQVKDLPPAVQKTVAEQTKGAQIKGISRETEKGVVQYEIETLVSGKARDFNVDTSGKLLVVEEEVPIDRIPPAARFAIEKKTAGGRITRVETVTEDGVTSYEAAYTKGGRTHEIGVKADGSEMK